MRQNTTFSHAQQLRSSRQIQVNFWRDHSAGVNKEPRSLARRYLMGSQMRLRPWPFTLFEIHTPLPPEMVFNVLQSHSEPTRFLRGWGDHKYFEGECSEAGFKLRRVIQYQNSFLPVINGRIIREGAGSLIKVQMRLHVFAAAFMAFWFGTLVWISLSATPNFFANLAKADHAALLTIAMGVFGVALMSGGFWFEASKQQDKLVELLQSSKKPSSSGPFMSRFPVR